MQEKVKEASDSIYTGKKNSMPSDAEIGGGEGVPLLLSMGNAGVRARTKRITACMPRRAPTWTERTRKDNVKRREGKEGTNDRNQQASERANEGTNEPTNKPTKESRGSRGVHRVAVKREQATPREPTAHRRHCGSAFSSFLSPLAGPLVYIHAEREREKERHRAQHQPRYART